MLQSALIPLSLRESRFALNALASDMCAMGTTRATLVHVATGASSAEEALAEKLHEKAEIFQEHELEIDVKVCKGSPALELTRTAIEIDVDYIAFCWKKKTWLQRALIGSTTQDSIRLSDRPVYIWKRGARARFQSQTSGRPHDDSLLVVYATDFGAVDARVIPLLRRPTLPVDRLVLLHIGPRAPDPAAEHRRLDAAAAQLERLAAECDNPNPAIRNVTGNPKHAITREASRLGARLVVLGKSDNARRFSAVLGSTAEALAFQSRASVLIVPPPLDGPHDPHDPLGLREHRTKGSI